LSIKETVKNFSMLDGAFIIEPNGTIISAGTYLDAPTENVALPKGLGARHRAAGAITSKTKAIAVVVSQSGAIRIFKDGNIILEVGRR
ncbi:MAG: diadenylate cyclase, partial [Candidatus Thermoplasmatota archaeon]